jgi:hypothetical protein
MTAPLAGFLDHRIFNPWLREISIRRQLRGKVELYIAERRIDTGGDDYQR